jgi:hypothetical protein
LKESPFEKGGIQGGFTSFQQKILLKNGEHKQDFPFSALNDNMTSP